MSEVTNQKFNLATLPFKWDTPETWGDWEFAEEKAYWEYRGRGLTLEGSIEWKGDTYYFKGEYEFTPIPQGYGALMYNNGESVTVTIAKNYKDFSWSSRSHVIYQGNSNNNGMSDNLEGGTPDRMKSTIMRLFKEKVIGDMPVVDITESESETCYNAEIFFKKDVLDRKSKTVHVVFDKIDNLVSILISKTPNGKPQALKSNDPLASQFVGFIVSEIEDAMKEKRLTNPTPVSILKLQELKKFSFVKA